MFGVYPSRLFLYTFKCSCIIKYRHQIKDRYRYENECSIFLTTVSWGPSTRLHAEPYHEVTQLCDEEGRFCQTARPRLQSIVMYDLEQDIYLSAFQFPHLNGNHNSTYIRRVYEHQIILYKKQKTSKPLSLWYYLHGLVIIIKDFYSQCKIEDWNDHFGGGLTGGLEVAWHRGHCVLQVVRP